MFRLLARLKGSWLRILLLAALTLAGVYSDLYLPSLMARIINDGITSGDQRLILLTGMEMLLFALLGVLCAVSSGILSSQVSMGFGRDLRGAVFRKTAALSLTEFEAFGTATLITRTTNDINQVQMFIMMAFRILIRAPLMIVGGVTMAFTSSPSLSRVVLLSVPALVVTVVAVSSVALPLSGTIQRSVDRGVRGTAVRRGQPGPYRRLHPHAPHHVGADAGLDPDHEFYPDQPGLVRGGADRRR